LQGIFSDFGLEGAELVVLVSVGEFGLGGGTWISGSGWVLG